MNEFFLNNPQVNLVELVWENWIVNPDGSGGYIIKFKKFDNPKPRYPVSGTDMLIREVSSIPISFDGTSLPYSFLQNIN